VRYAYVRQGNGRPSFDLTINCNFSDDSAVDWELIVQWTGDQFVTAGTVHRHDRHEEGSHPIVEVPERAAVTAGDLLSHIVAVAREVASRLDASELGIT
jgi:hypothetical protein